MTPTPTPVNLTGVWEDLTPDHPAGQVKITQSGGKLEFRFPASYSAPDTLTGDDVVFAASVADVLTGFNLPNVPNGGNLPRGLMQDCPTYARQNPYYIDAKYSPSTQTIVGTIHDEAVDYDSSPCTIKSQSPDPHPFQLKRSASAAPVAPVSPSPVASPTATPTSVLVCLTPEECAQLPGYALAMALGGGAIALGLGLFSNAAADLANDDADSEDAADPLSLGATAEVDPAADDFDDADAQDDDASADDLDDDTTEDETGDEVSADDDADIDEDSDEDADEDADDDIVDDEADGKLVGATAGQAGADAASASQSSNQPSSPPRLKEMVDPETHLVMVQEADGHWHFKDWMNVNGTWKPPANWIEDPSTHTWWIKEADGHSHPAFYVKGDGGTWHAPTGQESALSNLVTLGQEVRDLQSQPTTTKEAAAAIENPVGNFVAKTGVDLVDKFSGGLLDKVDQQENLGNAEGWKQAVKTAAPQLIDIAANVATDGMYGIAKEGLQAVDNVAHKGVAQGLTDTAKDLLPIDEAKTALDSSKSWDQRLMAVGDGLMKTSNTLAMADALGVPGANPEIGGRGGAHGGESIVPEGTPSESTPADHSATSESTPTEAPPRESAPAETAPNSDSTAAPETPTTEPGGTSSNPTAPEGTSPTAETSAPESSAPGTAPTSDASATPETAPKVDTSSASDAAPVGDMPASGETPAASSATTPPESGPTSTTPSTPEAAGPQSAPAEAPTVPETPSAHEPTTTPTSEPTTNGHGTGAPSSEASPTTSEPTTAASRGATSHQSSDTPSSGETPTSASQTDGANRSESPTPGGDGTTTRTVSSADPNTATNVRDTGEPSSSGTTTTSDTTASGSAEAPRSTGTADTSATPTTGSAEGGSRMPVESQTGAAGDSDPATTRTVHSADPDTANNARDAGGGQPRPEATTTDDTTATQPGADPGHTVTDDSSQAPRQVGTPSESNDPVTVPAGKANEAYAADNQSQVPGGSGSGSTGSGGGADSSGSSGGAGGGNAGGSGSTPSGSSGGAGGGSPSGGSGGNPSGSSGSGGGGGGTPPPREPIVVRDSDYTSFDFQARGSRRGDWSDWNPQPGDQTPARNMRIVVDAEAQTQAGQDKIVGGPSESDQYIPPRDYGDGKPPQFNQTEFSQKRADLTREVVGAEQVAARNDVSKVHWGENAKQFARDVGGTVDSGTPFADIVGEATDGYHLAEGKGSDLAKAVEQFESTAQVLSPSGRPVARADIYVPEGTMASAEARGWRVETDGQLSRRNSAGGWDRVFIGGNNAPVYVTEVRVVAEYPGPGQR